MVRDDRLHYFDFGEFLNEENVAKRTAAGDGTEQVDRGVDYVFDPGLVRAISAAITLNRPLLITGEPGCGKTELGYAIARALSGDRPTPVQHYTCRSADEVQGIFYFYDAMRRFHSIQVAGTEAADGTERRKGFEAGPFITYKGFGKALLDAWGVSRLEDFKAHDIEPDPGRAVRSVVIIDEIDKASRDFCNDLLEQLDRYAFEVPELLGEADFNATPDGDKLPRSLRPIVIIASNSERLLPEPFLRRCIYHGISPPTGVRLDKIIEKHLMRDFAVNEGDAVTIETVKKTYLSLRNQALSKPPGTAELIDATLVAMALTRSRRPGPDELYDAILSALVKEEADMRKARDGRVVP